MWFMTNPKARQAYHGAARLKDKRMELDENEKEALNERPRLVADHVEECPETTIIYFQPAYLYVRRNENPPCWAHSWNLYVIDMQSKIPWINQPFAPKKQTIFTCTCVERLYSTN